MNTFAVGVLIEYQGLVGTITFYGTEYLTFCIKTPEGGMHGPVCLVVYSSQWDEIKVLNSHHRD